MKSFKEFMEQLSPDQKKNIKLNYQYKQVTDPKPRVIDPVKAEILKLKKV